MPYTMTYDKKTDCICISIEGELAPALFKSMAADAAPYIKKYGCKTILNDLRKATLPESAFDIYSMPERALNAGVTREVRRALVVSESFSDAGFLETVFLNQGNIVKIFHNIADAKHWLFHEKK